MKRNLTEKQVKDLLQIDSFRNLSKDKVMEFASMIPYMDKDVAISIINQFPSYIDSATSMIQQYKSMCDNAITANKDSQMEAISAYRKILDDLGGLLKKENITTEERSEITNQMIEIADKISAKDTEHKDMIKTVLKYGGSLITGALFLGAVILGVNAKGVELPQIKK